VRQEALLTWRAGCAPPCVQGELLAELEGELYDLRDQLGQAAGKRCLTQVLVKDSMMDQQGVQWRLLGQLCRAAGQSVHTTGCAAGPLFTSLCAMCAVQALLPRQSL
jgi:hypothetical protein